MLFYKAWRESQTRFLMSACVIAGLCTAFVIFRHDASNIADRIHSYTEYIWRIVYKGYLCELFVPLAVLLGVGGLMRERDYGTAGFTLALPVSRSRFILARAAVGLLEVVVLALLPALIIPALSQFVGAVYPWTQALQFSLLWMVAGAFLFAIGFLASIFIPGEYTAPAAAIIAMLGYSLLADLPFVERYIPDLHDMMSGIGMHYFRADLYLLVGPLPWTTLAAFVAITGCSIAFATLISRRQDY